MDPRGNPENQTRKRKGRPKGSRNKIPGDLRELAPKIEQEHGRTVEEAWLRGLKARPPCSAKYLELLL